MKKGYVDTVHGQVHYRRDGDKGPDLFLFHESPLSSRTYEKCLPILGRAARAVAFDTPGYGFSDPPGAPVSIEDYAGRLLEAIDAMGSEEFAVAAAHTGASIAVELIRVAEPGRVTHAIFSGMPLLTAEQVAAFAPRIEPPDPDAGGGHLQKIWASRQRSAGEDASLEQIQATSLDMMQVYDRYDWGLRAAFDYDPEPALRALACPVLFLNGAGDSLAEMDQNAAGLVAGSALILNPDCGTQICWRAPDFYAGEVLKFLGVEVSARRTRR